MGIESYGFEAPAGRSMSRSSPNSINIIILILILILVLLFIVVIEAGARIPDAKAKSADNFAFIFSPVIHCLQTLVVIRGNHFDLRRCSMNE